MFCRRKTNVFFVDEVNTCMAGLKSATHESLETGAKAPQKIQKQSIGVKKIVNFQSLSSKQYPEMAASGKPVPTAEPDFSTYSNDYGTTRRKLRPPCKREELLPDKTFCHRPTNVFDMLPGSTYKFMDDHLRHDFVPESRKKIDFFRQIRWPRVLVNH
ncbi:hypothetical protein KR018_004240 [Drosophila ironensis]|nr:hypothetical protein KR018_004240 [Drosophila ironensis]